MFKIFLHFLSCGLIFVLIYQLMSLFLTERKKAWYIRGLSILIPCVILCLINTFHNPIYNTLTMVALCIIISLSAFQGDLRTRIIIGIIAPSIELSCEFLVVALDSTLMNRTLSQSSSCGLSNIAYIYLGIGLFCIAVIAIRLYVLTQKQKRSKHVIPPNPVIIIIPILSAAFLYYTLHTSSFIDRRVPIQIMTIIFYIGILIINIVFLIADNYSYNQYLNHTELAAMAHQVQLYELLIKQQEVNIEQLTASAHDFSKILSTLRQYLADTYGDDGGICRIIGQEIRHSSAAVLKYTYNSKTLTAIIRDYAAKCDKAGIFFEPEISYDDLDFISFQDLCTLLCNLLENSYASAVSTLKNQSISDDKPYVIISIFRKNKMLFIRVRNSFVYKGKKGMLGLKVKQPFDRREYGIGIKNVYHIVEKYEGSASFQYTKFEFHAHIIIPILK